MKVTDKTTAGAGSMEGTHASKRKTGVSKSSMLDKDPSSDISSAKVKFSERAQDIKKIRSAVDSAPDVDDAKVAKFKSMIAKGDYKVDSKQIADRMVDEHAYSGLFDDEE